MENLNIRHDIIQHIFFTRVRDGVARLNYSKPDKTVMDLTETYVPSSDRGKGVGGSLVDHAIMYARERDLKIKPSCPFVKKYLKEQKQASP